MVHLNHTQITEIEMNKRKALAILAIKYANVQPDSLAYWIALADIEQDNTQQKGDLSI